MIRLRDTLAGTAFLRLWSPTMTYRELCGRIRQDARRIVDDWMRLTQGEPWERLPTAQRNDHLPPVIAGLAKAAPCTPRPTRPVRDAVWKAVAHGEERRAQGIPDDAIFREHYFLRKALRHYVRETVPDPDEQLDVIGLLDAGSTLATTASLYGFYRRNIEEARQWPERIERLIVESPLS